MEFCRSRKLSIVYDTVSETRLESNQVKWIEAVTVDGRYRAEGTGTSRKKAQAAASEALMRSSILPGFDDYQSASLPRSTCKTCALTRSLRSGFAGDQKRNGIEQNLHLIRRSASGIIRQRSSLPFGSGGGAPRSQLTTTLYDVHPRHLANRHSSFSAFFADRSGFLHLLQPLRDILLSQMFNAFLSNLPAWQRGRCTFQNKHQCQTSELYLANYATTTFLNPVVVDTTFHAVTSLLREGSAGSIETAIAAEALFDIALRL